MQEKNVRSNVT